MVPNIQKPNFLGFPITPWFVVFCVSLVIGVVLLVALIVLTIKGKKGEKHKKETAKLHESANVKKAKLCVKCGAKVLGKFCVKCGTEVK